MWFIKRQASPAPIECSIRGVRVLNTRVIVTCECSKGTHVYQSVKPRSAVQKERP